MSLRINKIVPGFIKSIIWQGYLRAKFSRGNILFKKINFSKDLIIGQKCIINDGVYFGQNVTLGNGVIIGKNSFLEKIELSDNTMIEQNVICSGYGNGKIRIGHNSYIGLFNVLDWSNNISIGNYVHIAGPSTGLWTHSSALMCLNSIPLVQKSEIYRPTSPIIIEDNVYIGGNCTLYPGITIHHHSIIAPNSAVNKDVPSFSMVGGVPAKFIKNI